MTDSRYTVVLLPPDYPEGCFPGRCRHDPQFVMYAAVRTVKRPRRSYIIETEHSVCLACGLSRPATYGGNIFVDLHRLWVDLGHNAKIGSRILTLRGKWAKIARHLFDGDGWNGRHEGVARLIDPHLTMRIEVTDIGHGRFMANIRHDQDYLREAA